MPHYVYIIQSLKDHSFYKGYSTDPIRRLKQHNNLESTYTSTKAPWKLVYVEEFESKKEALIREKNLKKATHDRIHHLILHPKNCISKFIAS